MMTQRKLTDSELAARLRQRNRDSSERRRERLALAGHTQLLTWIPASLRERVDAAAAASGLKLSPMVERLLLAGLNATTTPATTTPYCCLRCDAPIPADCEDAPVCADCNREMNAIAESCNATTTPAATTPATTTRDALMTEVGKLLDEGLSGAEVARRLTAAGYRSPNGAALTGANLLRDYRRWQQQQGDGAA